MKAYTKILISPSFIPVQMMLESPEYPGFYKYFIVLNDKSLNGSLITECKNGVLTVSVIITKEMINRLPIGKINCDRIYFFDAPNKHYAIIYSDEDLINKPIR